MSIYKITNITNSFGKRELKNNSNLSIDYTDGLIKKTIQIKPGETVYLTVPTLPLSAHRLSVKKLITVIEISQSELLSLIEIKTPKIKINSVNIKSEKIEELPKFNIKKRDIKKEV